MKVEKLKIYPKDVVLIPETLEMLKDPTGKLWAKSLEDTARHQNATVTICKECNEKDAEYKGGLCIECTYKKKRLRYDSLPTTNEFPISLDGDQFFWDIGDLEDYCEENDVKVENLFLYGCEQKPFDELTDSWWDDSKTEDGELSAEFEKLIADFNKKLSEISGHWYCDNGVRYKP